MTDAPRKRILVEGSKLADEGMDGIKRYVAELLRAYRDGELDGRFDVDVAILDRVYPLAEVPARYLPRASGESQEDEEGVAVLGPRPGVRHRILKGLGVLIPPIVLHPIKWLIPDFLARRFLGKPKSALSVPGVGPGGRNILALLLPPVVFHVIQKLLPPRIVLSLWARGIFHLPPWPVDLEGYDLIQLTLPNNYHYLKPSRIPMLVTVHDLCHVACPEFQNRPNMVTLAVGLDRAVENAASFLSVSESTREQMIEVYDLDPSRVVAVHSGCNEDWFHPVEDSEVRARARRKYRIPDAPFLLTLSTIEPRKNLAGTVRAFETLIETTDHPNVVLVIAGARGWKSQEVIRAAQRNPDRIHLTGYVDDADLAALYSGARGFVFASHYEGFGFPALEAMRCGLPVIYGNNSALPEIVGEAGLPVDADDRDDIARQLHRLLSDDDLARDLGERARRRAAEFSWKRTARETVAVYEQVLRARSEHGA